MQTVTTSIFRTEETNKFTKTHVNNIQFTIKSAINIQQITNAKPVRVVFFSPRLRITNVHYKWASSNTCNGGVDLLFSITDIQKDHYIVYAQGYCCIATPHQMFL